MGTDQLRAFQSAGHGTQVSHNCTQVLQHGTTTDDIVVKH